MQRDYLVPQQLIETAGMQARISLSTFITDSHHQICMDQYNSLIKIAAAYQPTHLSFGLPDHVSGEIRDLEGPWALVANFVRPGIHPVHLSARSDGSVAHMVQHTAVRHLANLCLASAAGTSSLSH